MTTRLPKGWRYDRIKDHFRIVSGNGFKVDLQGVTDGDYPMCKASDIRDAKHILTRAANFVTDGVVEQERFNIIPAGSILFAKIGEAMKKNNRAIAGVDCCVDNNCQGLVPNKIDSGFAYYLFCCIDMRQFDNGGTIPYINNQKLRTSKFMLPPRDEQERIAAFLDAKCADVDKAIAAKRKQLECLDALWKSHLQTITTRGIGNDLVRSRVPRDRETPDRSRGTRDRTVLLPTNNPRYPLVPVGWQIKRVKRICSMSSGEHLGSEDIAPDGEFPVYGGNGLRGYFSRYNTEGIHILVGRQGALCGNVHLVDGQFWATEHALVVELRPNYDVEYIAFMFDAMNFNQYVSQSAAQPGLAASKILNVEAVIPPMEEQRRLAKILKERRANLDALAANLRKQIETLEQYRKSLIHECVTGARRCE